MRVAYQSDNRSDKTNYFFANPTRKEVFTKKTRKKTTRKETRKRLKELKLAVTLSKVINHGGADAFLDLN